MDNSRKMEQLNRILLAITFSGFTLCEAVADGSSCSTVSFPGNTAITVPWDGTASTNKACTKTYADGVERIFYWWEYIEEKVLVDDLVNQYYCKREELLRKMLAASITEKFADANVSSWESWVFPYVMKRVIERQNYCVTTQVVRIVTATNAIVHYVASGVQPPQAESFSESTGFVNVITEVTGGGAVSVPSGWKENYPDFELKYGTDFAKALMKLSGKKDAAGLPMYVWQDYVAGTDPTDEASRFSASVTIVDGRPVVSWSPELAAEDAKMRIYTVYGKVKLSDSNWTVVSSGHEDDFNFYKVTVEMR